MSLFPSAVFFSGTTMVNSKYSDSLKEKAAMLPLCPGVYIMHDASGKIIYVGKSRKLKNRVSQYFNNTDFKSVKTDNMTSKIADFEYIVCDSEIEALSLENSLIKLHKPKYNIKLKDDKSYPYIAIDLTEEYPKFFMTRSRKDKKVRYYGPYTSTAVVYGVIAAMDKAFGLPSCRHSFPKDKGKIRHCIYRQMGCVAPCLESVSEDDYKLRLNMALDFLTNGSSLLVQDLKSKMMQASEKEQYELAALFRDRIRAIEKLSDKQKVVAQVGLERDVVAVHSEGEISAVTVLYVRDGKLMDSETEYYSGGEIIDSSALVTFLCELYEKRGYIPKEIESTDVLSKEDAELLSGWLSSKAEYKVRVNIPSRGDKAKLVRMAEENAEQKCREYKSSTSRNENTLYRLAKIAGLEVLPERIEAFDISNIGNENIVAGMVVFVNGKPSKSDYRLFRMKNVEVQDDYASMREALKRHLAHLADGTSVMPDLILLDGGRGHLSTISELFAEENCSIPLLGMVKDDKHRTRALVSEDGEIDILSERDVFALIYRIQEEVHRYTVGSMSRAKRKTEKTSVLENIKGIGPAKARSILHEFGGLAEVKNAGEEDLMKIKGINEETAKAIVEYFAAKKGKTR